MFTSQTIREFVRARTPGAQRIASVMRFSIIMPSYNHARFIERRLNSALNQEHEGTKLIVIHGGSRDGTPGVLKSNSPHVAEKVRAGQRLITEPAGTEWKYALGGRALRLADWQRGAECLS